MRIAEVFLLEAYFDDLQVAVMDRLAQADSEEQSNISTEQFRQSLASDGFLLSVQITTPLPKPPTQSHKKITHKKLIK